MTTFNRSFWQTDSSRAAEHPFAPLATSTECDVLIVGGGITGLTAALHLSLAGKKVIVVEMNFVGGATTGYSTGHLDTMADRHWSSLISKFGEAAIKHVVAARRSAIDLIEQWNTRYQCDADFRRIDGWLYGEPDQDLSQLESEHDAARRLGLDVQLTQSCPLSFAATPALRIANQGRINPWRYVRRLADAAVAAGATIHEKTRMESNEEQSGCVVKTNRGEISSQAVLLCGHAALEGFITVDTRNEPFQSYVVAVETPQPISDAIYWDLADPYHYTRIASTDRPNLLIIGGADHHTGSHRGKRFDTRQSFEDLEQYVMHRYPGARIVQQWSHQFFEPVDGLPYVGRVPWFKRTYIATGFSGEGLTQGTVAGGLLSDLILERENPLAEIWSPSRLKPLASAKHLLHIGIEAVKGLLLDRLAPSELTSLDEVQPETGALVRVSGKKLAVYRDEKNQLHIFSPVCRHMSCIVQWNQAERTWDCPCHGGRYSALGEVVTGPPKHHLERVDLSELTTEKADQKR